MENLSDETNGQNNLKQALIYAKDLSVTYKKLRTIVDAMSDGMIVTDRHFVVTDANESASHIFERPRRELIKTEMERLFNDDLGEPLSCLKGENAEASFEVKTGQHDKTVLRVSASCLPEDMGFVFVLRDITSENRAKNMKNEFLNIISHELRTPLSGIIGLTYVLRTELADNLKPEQLRYFDLLKQSEDRMLKTVKELVSFAQFKGLQPESGFESVDLDRLFSELLKKFKALADQKEIAISYSPAKSGAFIEGNNNLLHDLFDHVIRNAIIFGNPRGYVLIYLNEKDEQYEIFIKDNGIGIQSKHLEKIFDTFYQVEDHLTRKVEGLGLGLTIARHIAKFHGGTIKMESTPGKGSTCVISLPKTSKKELPGEVKG